MIYTLGPLVAWFIVVFVHAYLSYKEEMEIEEDKRKVDKEKPAYRYTVYRYPSDARPPKPIEWLAGIDPYKNEGDTPSVATISKRTSSGLVTYFQPSWAAGKEYNKFGLLIPSCPYHKPGNWETHHGMIDLHWHRDIRKLRQRLKKDLLSIPTDTEGRFDADLWKELPPPDDEELRLFNEYIYRTKEEMMRELGISVDRDGRNPKPRE